MSGAADEPRDAGRYENRAAGRRYLVGSSAQRAGVLPVPRGHSNLTTGVPTSSIVLRCRRSQKVKTPRHGRSPHPAAPRPVYPQAPRPLVSCEDESVIGAPFYLMERRHGVILRKELPRGMTIDAAQARGLSELLIDALVELHAIDYAAAGLGDFGKPAGYVERQVRGWTERYGGSQTDDIPAVTEVSVDAAPPEARRSLIHNDFKFAPDPGPTSGGARRADWEWRRAAPARISDLEGYWASRRQPALKRWVRHARCPGDARLELCDRSPRSGATSATSSFYYAYGLFRRGGLPADYYVASG